MIEFKCTDYFKRFRDAIFEYSVNQVDFNIAILEWIVIKYMEYDQEEHSNAESYQCICGKEDIKYLSVIYNKHNGNRLDPIGSVCIKKYFPEEVYHKFKILRLKYRQDKKEQLLEIERRKRIENEIRDYGNHLFSYKYGTFRIDVMSKNVGFMEFVLNTRTPNKKNVQKETQYEKLIKYYYLTKGNEILV